MYNFRNSGQIIRNLTKIKTVKTSESVVTFIPNLEKSRIPVSDARFMTFEFLSIITFILTKNEKRTKNSLKIFKNLKKFWRQNDGRRVGKALYDLFLHIHRILKSSLLASLIKSQVRFSYNQSLDQQRDDVI